VDKRIKNKISVFHILSEAFVSGLVDGIQEVVSSILISSTIKEQGVREERSPFFLK